MKVLTIFFGLIQFLNCSSNHLTKKYSGHGKSSISNAILEKYLSPPLNPQDEKKIQRYLDILAPKSGILSPDGKKMYFGWSITGTTQIWSVNGPNQFPTQMTGGSETTYIYDITLDGKYILLYRDSDGKETPGLFFQSTNGGPIKTIFKKEGVRTYLQWVSKDPNKIYYKANDKSKTSYTFYQFNFKTKKRKIFLKERKGHWFIADVDEKREIFLIGHAPNSLSRQYFEYHAKEKKLVPLLGLNEETKYYMAMTNKKDEYFVQTNKFSNFHQLYKWRKGKWTLLTRPQKRELDSFSVDRQKKRIFLSWNDQGHFKLEAYSVSDFKKLPLPIFKKAIHVYAGRTTRDGKYTSLVVANENRPRTNYVYDWINRKLTKWVYSSIPQIDTQNFVKDELKYYPAQDGTMIPMFVRKPKNLIGPYKIIVYFHGGPESQSLPGFNPIIQLYINNGYVYVRPNIRGSEGYGKKWSNADNGAKRLNIISDIRDAATYLKKKYTYKGIPPKMAIMGGSYGGYLTLLAMTKYAGTYDAGVSRVGMSNLLTFLENTAPYRRALRISEYGDPQKNKSVLLELSPITYIDQLKDPLLIIQGVNDPRVPVGEALQFKNILNKKNIPSKLILFPNEGHGISKRENRVKAIGYTINFLNKHMNF